MTFKYEPQRIRGTIIEAGGGEVRVLVTRDTEQYPEVGSMVTLYIPIPPHAYRPSGMTPWLCGDCGCARWSGGDRLIHGG